MAQKHTKMSFIIFGECTHMSANIADFFTKKVKKNISLLLDNNCAKSKEFKYFKVFWNYKKCPTPGIV